MDELLHFLEELSSNAKIPMKICVENNSFCLLGFDKGTEPSVQFAPIEGEALNIHIYKSFSSSIDLLKYIISSKYRELFYIKDKVFDDIIEGRTEDQEHVSRLFPYFNRNSVLFIVSVNEDPEGALSILQELYNKQEVSCLLYKNDIVLWGIFDDIMEHASSIRDSILTNLYSKCSICFSEPINNLNDLKKEYKKAKKVLLLKKEFIIEEDILCYNKLLFENVIFNIPEEVKNELIIISEPVLNNFDNELINTIEQFFKNDLSISETSKKLYVHRNTLIYRLDKITKETGYDIRNFKEAALFFIIFLIWKESKR